MVQTLRMPVQVFSGIRPPQALLSAMSCSQPPQPSSPFNVTPQTPSSASRPPQPFAPTSSDIPADAPPSYEDAIADDIGPIDGPRREYTQPLHSNTQASSSGGYEKTAGDRLFTESGR